MMGQKKNTVLAINLNGYPITDLKEYAVIIGMNHTTLYIYCHDDNSKCQLIGTGFGKNNILLNGADIYFMGNVLVWADCGTNGMRHTEFMDAIQQINHTLYRKQAKAHLDRRVLTKACADGKIKRRNLKSQETTTERTAIMYKSQWLWYGFVTGMFNYLRKNNVGVCKKIGKKFGQLMQNFVLVLGEACIMADNGKNIRIIGSVNRKKYENILADR